MSEYINQAELRKALSILKPNNELFEIRILMKPKKTLSGYFKSIDKAIEELSKQNLRNANVFWTLNVVREECYDRIQHDTFAIPENTTADPEILGYKWLLIDLDPVRPTGVSSTDEQLKLAKVKASKIVSYLRGQGFEEPVIAMSGNGYHLLYLINAKTERESIIEQFLKAIDLLFSDDDVKVDTANFNPSRICKLYGTLAQKGAGTDERPHRMSYIYKAPEEPRVTSVAYIQKIADLLPKKEAPQAYNNYNPTKFDVEDWMRKYGIRYEEKSGSEYRKYILDVCPFNHNHKAPDSMITVGSSGAIGFHCFHDSCQNKTWRDVRMMFEPDAYDRSEDDERINAGWRHHVLNRNIKINYEELTDETPEEPFYYTAKDIDNLPNEEDVFIRSGIDGIDNRLLGLKKGYVSLLTGLRGGSKSTLLTTIALSAIQDGNNVLCYSGELTAKDFMTWMKLQAAGKDHVEKSKKWNNYYYVKKEDSDRITEWLGGHLLLWNNNHGNNFKKLYTQLKIYIEKQKTDLVILDNLMSMDIRVLNPHDKYEAQTDFVEMLSGLAKKTKTHILFVAHPRKAIGFLRLDDVSGSGNLTNRIDNAFIVHRNNNDFQRLSREMFKWPATHEAYSGTNVIEIAKDRLRGNIDVFIPLWYEPETKRLKNSPAETVKYGWLPDDGWMVPTPDEIPF